MGKKKSAAYLVLITVLILGLCLMCFLPFFYGGVKGFNPFPSMSGKDALLGNGFADGYTTDGGDDYIGGGYSFVFYPEGVIPLSDYEDNLESKTGDEQTKYAEKYQTFGELCIEKELLGEDGKPGEDFLAAFDAAVCQFRTRVRELNLENAALDIVNDYSVRVFLPDLGNRTTQFSVFRAVGTMGEFTLSYGSSADSATPLSYSRKENGEFETINDYVDGAYSMVRGGTSYVVIRFTSKGRDMLQSWTSDAANSSVTIYFKIGDTVLIPLTINETITEKSLPISGSYTSDSAHAIALAIDTAVNSTPTDLSFTAYSGARHEALFGGLALTLCYVAFGVIALAMLAFFFVRYHLLGFVQLYSFLIYLLPMIVLIWGIPFLHIGIETFLAVLFGAALLSFSNIAVFESARKEFALGKTIASSVKASYKKHFWGVFDVHVIVALLAFVTYFISITQLSVFAFTLGLGAVLSGLISLAVGRLNWAAMMSLAKNKGAFCNFKRGEDTDDE